jgi:hypothetical protein
MPLTIAEKSRALRRERKRIMAREMATQLSVSMRGFANIKKLGMPCTQVGGYVWYEPEKVHEWLDQFNRNGVPGKRFKRNPAVLTPPPKKAARKHQGLTEVADK